MFLCYSVLKCVFELHILKLLLLPRDTVDLQRPIFWDFFFFHVKPSISILTKVSKTTFVKYRCKRELFTQTYFRTKCEFSKSIFRGKTSCFLEFTRVYVS